MFLQTDYEQSGIRCRLQGPVGLARECGKPHYPACGQDMQTMGSCDDASACEDGATCVHEAGLGRDTCFAACEQEGDCALEAEDCIEGACRLTAAL